MYIKFANTQFTAQSNLLFYSNIFRPGYLFQADIFIIMHINIFINKGFILASFIKPYN